jgi:hypothetical protein
LNIILIYHYENLKFEVNNNFLKKKSIIKFDSKPKYLIINHIVRIINTTRFKIKHIQMSEFIFMLKLCINVVIWMKVKHLMCLKL